MKKNILYFLLIMVGCQNGDTQTGVSLHSTAIATVIDLTDKKKLWPLPDPILQLFHCDQFPDDAYYFHLSVISDKKLNPANNIQLPAAAAMETQNTNEDPQFRNKAVVQFYKNVRDAFTAAYTEFDTTKATDFSECFTGICQQLQWLQQTKSSNKYLLVYSDLVEKSKLFNAYRDIAKGDTAAMRTLFVATHLLPEKLNGITVFFVYQPLSREEDERFSVMSSIYLKVLTKRGAKVSIQANNKTYNL